MSHPRVTDNPLSIDQPPLHRGKADATPDLEETPHDEGGSKPKVG